MTGFTTAMGEVWREVEGFPPYAVSSLGNIRNVKRNKNLLLSIRGGYMHVSLSNGSKRRTLKVHRLVAAAFVTNPSCKPTVNHKDHCKTNNAAGNLEWATMAEQGAHRRKRDLSKIVSARPVKQLTVCGRHIRQYESIRLAAVAMGKNLSACGEICMAAQGLRKTAYGFMWRYVDAVTLDAEVWEPLLPCHVNGTAGYMTSTEGRVKNTKGRISPGHPNSFGYLQVTVSPKLYRVHILVAKTFISNPEGKGFVNHRDGNKANAKLSNLEWVTNSENLLPECAPSSNLLSMAHYWLNMHQSQPHLGLLG